jgi:hypothetical protein
VLWFDTLFSERFCKEHPVELSTSPNAPLTHWLQTVQLLKQPVLMAPAATAAGARPAWRWRSPARSAWRAASRRTAAWTLRCGTPRSTPMARRRGAGHAVRHGGAGLREGPWASSWAEMSWAD